MHERGQSMLKRPVLVCGDNLHSYKFSRQARSNRVAGDTGECKSLQLLNLNFALDPGELRTSLDLIPIYLFFFWTECPLGILEIWLLNYFPCTLLFFWRFTVSLQLTRAYFAFLEVLFSSHIVFILNLDTSTFMHIAGSLESGLKGLDTNISSQVHDFA